jgi:hypothetical protein
VVDCRGDWCSLVPALGQPPEGSSEALVIGHVLQPFRGRYVLGSAAIGVLLYVGGLVAASAGGLGTRYLHSRVWALAAVTAWVFAWGESSDRALYDLPGNVQPALREPLARRDYDCWYRRFYDALRDLTAGTALAALVIGLTFAEPRFWTKRFPGWAAHLRLSQAILVPYFVVGALLTVTMLYGLWNYLRFADDILRRELNANLSIARASLQSLTSFGLATGFGWAIAVALVSEVFLHAAGFGALVPIAVFVLLGFALILVPQFLAHGALVRTRNELIATAGQAYGERDPARWSRRFLVDPDEPSVRARDFLRELDEASEWIYTPPQALLFVVQVAAALSAVLTRGIAQ